MSRLDDYRTALLVADPDVAAEVLERALDDERELQYQAQQEEVHAPPTSEESTHELSHHARTVAAADRPAVFSERPWSTPASTSSCD